MVPRRNFKTSHDYYNKFVNYCTRYATDRDSDFEVNYLSKAGTYCFSSIRGKFTKNINKCNYTIILDKASKARESLYNSCLFNKEEIRGYLNKIKQIYPFIFSVEGSLKENSYTIKLTISGTSTQHLFVLSCVRYLYEYPYNLILMDVLKYIKNKCYGNIENQNEHLFILLFAAFITCDKYIGYGHCTNGYPQYMFYKSINEIRNIVNSEKLTVLNNIFSADPYNGWEAKNINHIRFKFYYEGDYIEYENTVNDWYDKNSFIKRYKYMEYNLKQLKKLYLDNNVNKIK